MKNGRIKNSIACLLLIAFISMKMTGLHMLSHDDDKDHPLHCVICHHTITHNLTPTLTPTIQDFTFENIEYTPQTERIKNYNFLISSSITSDQLFSRPPPFSL